MRIIFLFVVMLNIIFFAWEYRKGAPDIYFLPSYESGTSLIEKHNIILITEPLAVHKAEAKVNKGMDKPVQQQKIKPENKRLIGDLQAEPKAIIADRVAQTPEKKRVTAHTSVGSVNKVIDSKPVQTKSVNKTAVLLTEKGAVGSENTNPEKIKTDKTITQALDKEKIMPSAASARVTKETDSAPVAEPREDVINIKKNTDLEKIESKTRQLELELELELAVASEGYTERPSVIKRLDSSPVVACYQLQQGEYTQETFAQSRHKDSFKLSLSEQENKITTRYLVLTEETGSAEEAEELKQKIREQGIIDLWLFKQGDFTGRISLGLYSSEAQATLAKQGFSLQTDQPLELVASHQTSIVSQVKISVQNKNSLTDFEKQYAIIIKQKISCTGEKL